MEDKTYYEHRDKAKIFYKNLKEIPCAVLDNEYIEFGNAGFQHLLKKGRYPRTKSDQIRRFLLLKYVPNIIKDPNVSIVCLEDKTACFWRITKRIEKQIIKVIIRQFPGENKHFFSVMNNKK